jgi:recombination protein RecA
MAKRKNFLDVMLDEFGEGIQVQKYEDGHPAISTGSVALDASTGIGGIPLGRFTEIYGPEQSGKSTLCLTIAKEALKLNYKVLYIDMENKLTHDYVMAILKEYYNNNTFVLLQPKSGEDGFKIAEAGIDSGFHLIIFDSVAAVSPEAELDDEIDKQHVGLTARLVNHFLRKTTYKVRTNEVAFIFSNQVRASIGSYYGGYSQPAGYALKHYTTLRIFLSKGQEIKDDDGYVVGNYVNFIIKKNNIGMPYRQAETNVIFGSGVDKARDLLKFASLLGVIKTKGSYYVFNDEVIAQGVEKTIQALSESKETLDKIEELCYNIAKVKYPPFRKEVRNEEES